MTVPIDFKGALERLLHTTHERLGCNNTGTVCEVHQVTYGPDGCPVALDQAHERHRRVVMWEINLGEMLDG